MTPAGAHARHAAPGALALGALGVVFGDIGTSPLYALKECVHPHHGVEPTAANIYGLLSLIFWALTMVVAVKYLTFVMRADNRGEGGILALLALVPERMRKGKSGITAIAALVVFGAALLYGDGIITPAISVLSAVEGIEVATPTLARFVVPITCGILVALFVVQRRGTGGIGKVFGPIMILWFATIGAMGVRFIARDPAILLAVSPLYAVRFCLAHGGYTFLVLGSVVLVVTGGEALYADMGHFGRGPIRLAWYALVMPTLLLNYFGQGALLIVDPEARDNPFFAMVPSGAMTWALVALSSAATVIASQALISGAFSLTHQAVQLGYLPRVNVRHTSRQTEGQIYVPAVNWALAISCIALVIVFRESSRLAAAYGIAVTGTMGITSYVYFVVLRKSWQWPLWKALPLLVLFLSWDLLFFGSSALKFVDGGYVPILVGLLLFTIMIVWRRGRTVLVRRLSAAAEAKDALLARLQRMQTARVQGTAVFLTSEPGRIPAVLVHYVEHTRALQERVLLLSVVTSHVPHVPLGEESAVENLGDGFFRVVVHAGFMEQPQVTERLRDALERAGLPLDLATTSFFLARETFLATYRGEMGRLTESLFSFLYKNAGSATIYFGLPPDRVVEIGMQLDL